MQINYKAPPTIKKFMDCDSFYRGIMGPVGSGKSSGCCMEIFKRANQQEPGADGIRRTRFVIVRNTYRELSDTTKKTWLDWFPEDIFGKFNESQMTHHVKFNDVEMEVLFRALDTSVDVKKLLSLELTMAWVNEAREVPKGVVDALGDRVGRYPAKKDGGCTWSGVIMDTNPPDDDHWWYKLAEESVLENWNFFRQPGGLKREGEQFVVNLGAENILNLPENYYTRNIEGKDKNHILVYYCCEYGFVRDGRAIYAPYSDSMHCTEGVLPPVPGIPITIGIDFGLTPAATLGQRLANGRWIAIDELVTEDMGTENFSHILYDLIMQNYRGFKFEIYGDPAGEQRAQTDERTPFQILRKNGIEAYPAGTNDFSIRIESVNSLLSRIIDGKPAIIISPKCKVLRKAMAGGYCFKRLKVSGDERYHDKPDKNKFSHVAEALQYMVIGDTKGREILGDMGQGAIIQAQQNYIDDLKADQNR